MENLIHMTAAYSNAVLLLVISNVSDFAKKLALPIPQPITLAQIQKFDAYPSKFWIGGVLTLTNGDRFFSHNGYIDCFYGYKNPLTPPQEIAWEDLDQFTTNFWGKVNMTRKEAIEFARDALRKLGIDPKLVHADGPPKEYHLRSKYKGKTIPFCSVEWESDDNDVFNIEINAEKKQIVRFSLVTGKLPKIDLKLDVVPELEIDYRKRTQGNIFIRTNAPLRLPKEPPPDYKNYK